jgi:hypothetical protein
LFGILKVANLTAIIFGASIRVKAQAHSFCALQLIRVLGG